MAALGELGAAVGDAGFVSDFLDQAFSAYQAFVGKVVAATVEADSSWSRVQAGVGLLRLCALPRLLHLFRALPPAATLGLAEKADVATLAGYQKLLTANLTTAPQQTQAALPTRLGGAGLLRFKDLRAQAWLGSWLGTLPAVRDLTGARLASREVLTQGTAGWAAALREAVDELAEDGVYLDQGGVVTREPPREPWGWDDDAPALAQRQRLFSRQRAEAARTRLLGSLPPAGRARLRGCGGPGAGAWLLAAPTSTATRFTDLEYRVCSRLRLRIPLGLGGRPLPEPAQRRTDGGGASWVRGGRVLRTPRRRRVPRAHVPHRGPRYPQAQHHPGRVRVDWEGRRLRLHDRGFRVGLDPGADQRAG